MRDLDESVWEEQFVTCLWLGVSQYRQSNRFVFDQSGRISQYTCRGPDNGDSGLDSAGAMDHAIMFDRNAHCAAGDWSERINAATSVGG